MKFKNILFSVLKTLLLVVVFYSRSLYASYMYLDLGSHQSRSISPYFFESNQETGDLIKVIDTQNNFQFKTYNLTLQVDIEEYNTEVRPVLLEWKKTVAPFGTDSYSSSELSKGMARSIEIHLEMDPPPMKVYVATYKGNIESVSYIKNTRLQTPEIDTIVANPEGLIEGQTMIVKGGGSALLEHVIKTYKEAGTEEIQLYSGDDQYYAKRGWKMKLENKIDEACGM